VTKTQGASARFALARGVERRVPRVLMLALKALSAVALICVVALGLVYVRLMHGPLSLDFLVRPIEAGIADEFPGAQVRVESAALHLNDSGLLQFQLKNLRISDAGGEPLVTAPTASVSLSRRALLTGRIAAESLDLMSARLMLLYSDDGALSLKFSSIPEFGDGGGSKSPPLRGAVEVLRSEPAGNLGRIDIVKVLSEASARARRRENASAYLREVGLRSAILIIDHGGRKSIWRVPELDLDLDHRRSRSSIAGRAKIESLAGPWEINFRTREHASAKSIHLAISVHGLVPRGLARSLPELIVFERLDLPIWADAQLELSSTGELLSGKFSMDSAPGKISIPWLAATPLAVDGSRIEATYDGAARRFDISRAILKWGDSNLELAGSVVQQAGRGQEGHWFFDIKSASGLIAAEPPAQDQLAIGELTMRGSLVPANGQVAVSNFLLRVGSTKIDGTADILGLGGAAKARIDARIGAMPVGLFKTLWPSWIAPGARSWAAARLRGGNILGGTFKVVQGYDSGGDDHGEGDRVSLALEGSDLELNIVEGWPALHASRGLLRLDRNTVEFAVPEASMSSGDGRRLALKGAFSVDLRQPLPRTGRVALRGDGALPLVLQLLDQDGRRALQSSGLAAGSVDGKLDANIVIGLPLVPNLKFADIHVEGRLRLSDGKVHNALGSYDAHRINLAVELGSSLVEAKGDFLIKGVPAKVAWQRAYDTPADKQPPLRITAKLDETERAQLGLDVNEMVHGEVAVDLAVHHDAQGERVVRVRADLTNTKVTLDGLAWEKPIGRSCVFEFDLVKGAAHPNELRNVRLVGQDIAVAGWIGAGADLRVKEFRFPQFNLNVVSVFETHGKLRTDNVWEVVAKGPTFEGKNLFQSFFDVEVAPDKGGKGRPGLDLRAEIDTVLGFYDTRLHNVKLSTQKRAGKMTHLDARGSFGGGKSFEAGIRSDPGRPRVLFARATDAGQMFKLVGFYPHAVGGDMSLEVNLDGRGAAERTGILTATKFHVLGDTVTLQNAQKIDPAARRELAREKFPFERLRAPFAVGNRQFVLREASIEGPLVSANMRGVLDFRMRKLHVGGTFTPLSDLNTVLRAIPLFGGIFTGPRGDGVIAITYAFKGPLENPQLEINPLSVFTPGFTRGLMEMTPEDPNVEGPQAKPSGTRRKGLRTPNAAPPNDTGN
jgi:hypothetical protein